MGMTRDEACDALEDVGAAMTAQHASQPDRLHQLKFAVATAVMAVNHLFDHAENAAAEAKEN